MSFGFRHSVGSLSAQEVLKKEVKILSINGIYDSTPLGSMGGRMCAGPPPESEGAPNERPVWLNKASAVSIALRLRK